MLSDLDNADGFEVVIHFGAHKTATTFLQEFLKSEQDQLRENGVGYVPLSVSRAFVMPFVSQSARTHDAAERPSADVMMSKIEEATEWTNKDASPIRRLLISDENLAGPALTILKKGVLYPSATYMLRVLVNNFPGTRLKLMLCIRDYADFIPSVYCEVLRRHKLAPLSKILSGNRDLFFSWPAYLADVAAAFPACDVYYWSYEDFTVSPADVVEAMTGVRLASIESTISRKVRPSLTRKAVTVLQSTRQHVTDGEHRRLAECLIDNMTFDDDSKLSIEDQSLAEELRQRYKDDVATLQGISETACGIVRRIKQ